MTVQHLFNTADVAEGWYVAAVSVGPHDDPVVLCSEKPLGFDESRSPSGITMKPRTTGPTRLRLHHQRAGLWNTVDLPAAEPALVFRVQPLPDNQWLLVHDTGRSGTAQIYSPDGQLQHAFDVGPHIEDVQTDASGQIWVSYFDEGVFGGPPGDAGLICFAPDGSVLLCWNNDLEGSMPFIDDCYALNVADSATVWLCYYSDFPLVRLTDRNVDGVWQSPVAGAHGLAVSGNQAILAGSYQARNHFYLVSLDNMEVRDLGAATASGQAIGPYSAVGRGQRLYLVTRGTDRWHGGEALYVLDIEAMPELANAPA